MTGSHSRLGTSDRESRTTGVIRAYDTGDGAERDRARRAAETADQRSERLRN